MRTEQQIFQDLGQALVDCSPAGWLSCRIVGCIHDDFGQVIYFVTTSDTKDQEHYPGGDTADRLYVLLDELRQIMRGAGRDVWNRVEVSLGKDGNLNAKFEYEDE